MRNTFLAIMEQSKKPAKWDTSVQMKKIKSPSPNLCISRYKNREPD